MHAPAARHTEATLVARWRAGAYTGPWLRTAEGGELRVIFAGRPGGPAGPDVRDAVLVDRDGRRVCGDVELHLRARGWRQHGHDADPHYDRVVLHVVEHAEGMLATPLSSGALAALLEVRPVEDTPGVAAAGAGRTIWPCAPLTRAKAAPNMQALLDDAGDSRFDEHVAAFTREFARPTCAPCAASAPVGADQCACDARTSGNGWTTTDRVLFTSLAEGLAYGRDRTALRGAGAWLAGGGAPDARARELAHMPALDATRLSGLLAWYRTWQTNGPWEPLKAALAAPSAAQAIARLMAALTVRGGVISPPRATILAVNVVLPCAVAWSQLHSDNSLASRARAAYVACPGLPANQITREMCRQLGMPRQPVGARAQQGLQHIWATHCRTKDCAACPCAVAH